LVAQERVERVAPDREAAPRAAHEVVAQPRGVLVERVAGPLPRPGERSLRLRALGREGREDRANERGARGRALTGDDDVDRRDALGVEVRDGVAQRARGLLEALGERAEPHLDVALL